MDPGSLQFIITLGVPILGFAAAIITRAERTPALYRRLRHSAALLKDLPESASGARHILEEIAELQAGRIQTREARRQSVRGKISLPWLTAAILLTTVVTPLVVWALLAWIGGTVESGWIWISAPVAVVSGLLLLFFMLWFWTEALDPLPAAVTQDADGPQVSPLPSDLDGSTVTTGAQQARGDHGY
ncbi:hypothetical protein [Agromyces arachidis]|uniref:hypothetical protein n=1 Tax=Agromyces arachidis TaxID=766966 RepID=UPI0040561C5B